MRTNIVLNDDLVREAFLCSPLVSTKRELVETALREYVERRAGKDIRDIRGGIRFSDGYDYKAMRK